MQKEFSIYLDAVRFIAAVLVVIYHSNLRNIITDIVPFSNYGHTGVIIFFVLSGYVIAYVSNTKEKSINSYWLSRSSRILSVALPAIVLTLCLDLIGESLVASFYDGKTTHDYWYIRVISSIGFLNEIWFVSIMQFSNVPYWSLCYEVWYYALFAAYYYLSGLKRLIWISVICLLIGPKILLLGPIWCLGVYLYYSKIVSRINEIGGWILFSLSIVLFYLFHEFDLTTYFSDYLKSVIGSEYHKQLTFSKFFIGDYLLAIIIFANFAGFKVICHRFQSPLIKVEKLVRYLAGYTFSIYLFHQPLILCYAALYNGDPNGYAFYFSVMTSVFLTVFIVGNYTEKKKTYFREIIQKMSTRMQLTRSYN